jgi:hypothetical protein
VEAVAVEAVVEAAVEPEAVAVEAAAVPARKEEAAAVVARNLAAVAKGQVTALHLKNRLGLSRKRTS